MKNLRKVVALVLAFAMVLSMGTVAFAAENTEADVLYDLGLFKGYSTTEKQLGLGDASNAYQAIVLIGRALGWDVNLEAAVAFTDVPDYAVPFVDAAVKKGITNGISVDTFGSFVDGKRMAAWTLRALGYDMTEAWNNTDVLAAQAGIEVVTGSITRASVVTVIYDTLMATPVGETMTVIEKLVAASPSMLPAAQAAGLVAVVVKDFGVASVEALGLKAIKVTFTADIDGEVTVVKEDAAGGVEDVIEDGAVAVIVLDTVQTQNMALKLEIDATGKDGIVLEDEKLAVTLTDKADPELVSVTVVNAKEIEVKYSEPIVYTEGSRVFNDVKIGDMKLVGKAELSADLTTITYTLSTPLVANAYVFTMEAVKDYAGFTAPSQAVTITVVADDAAPKLVDVKVTDNQNIVLVFDEKVAAIGSVSLGTWVIDGKEVKVALTTKLVASDAFVAVTGKYSEVEDILGNKSAKDVAFSFKAPFDSTAPTATVTVKDNGDLKVVFSEKVTTVDFDAFGIDAEDYALTTIKKVEADEVPVAVDSITYNATDDYYLVDISDAGKNVDPVDYRFTITDKVMDTSSLGNKFVKTAFVVSMPDNLAPTISGVMTIVDTDTLRITFSEAMDVNSLANLANYIYADATLPVVSLAVLKDAAAEVASNGKSVDLTIPGVAKDEHLSVLNVKDLKGTYLGTGDYNIYKPIDTPALFNDVTYKLTGLRTIQVSSTSHEFAYASANEFKVFVNGVESSTHYITSAVIDPDTANMVKLTLNADIKPDATTANTALTAVKIGITGVDTVDTFGQKLLLAPAVVSDDTAGTFTAKGGDNSIILTLNEKLDPTLALNKTAILADVLVRDKAGKVLTIATTDLAVTEANDVSVITISVGAITVETMYTVEVLSRNIVDKAFVPVNALSATEVTVK